MTRTYYNRDEVNRAEGYNRDEVAADNRDEVSRAEGYNRDEVAADNRDEVSRAEGYNRDEVSNDTDINGREVRVIGDLIIVSAEGMRRHYVRELAKECAKALQHSTITEKIESNSISKNH